MTRLLFTGGGGSGNEAIYRLWKDRYDLHFADAVVGSIHPSIPETRRHAIPFADDASFSEAVADLCKKMCIDLLVPGVDEELFSLVRIGSKIGGTQVLLPDEEYILNTTDKLATYFFFVNAGIDFPKTVSVDRAETIGFPCFAKPRKGRGSRGIQILTDRKSMEAHRVLSDMGPLGIVAQELLTGQEYTVLMAADAEASLKAIVPVKVVEKRGITIVGETEKNERIIDACVGFHKKLPAKGCYNIQLMLCDDGSILPFEINPRVSTTFCLGIAAGIDPVEIFLGRSDAVFDKGNWVDALLPFKHGLRLHRHWHNHFTDSDVSAPDAIKQ